MGCGNSKVQSANGGQDDSNGYKPRKLTKRDVEWEPIEIQWIVGNGTILNIDIRTKEMKKVQLPKGIIIGDRCATVFLAHDNEEDSNFIVCGGNDDFKTFYDVYYEFKISDPSNPVVGKPLPKPLTHHNIIETHAGSIFVIGGMTEKQSSDSSTEFPGTVVSDVWQKTGDDWKHRGNLPKPRANFETVVNGETVFIFCGGSGDGKPASTQIDIFKAKTGTFSTAKYRLPLGVVGASLAWHGRDVLLIGGERCKKASTGVMKLDFKDKTILSVRDLCTPRANTIIIPITYDETLAIGGSQSPTVEHRHWCEKEQDYIWEMYNGLKGMEVMGNPNEYNSVTVTFEVSGSDEDEFPAFNPNSNFIFGNELSPFFMEFTNKMDFRYYPAPMRLQQKTGQVAFRKDANTIFFAGGCDTTYTFFSKKFYKFDLKAKKVSEMDKLSVGRTGFTLVELDGWLYVTGGWTKGHAYLNGAERFNMNDESSNWEKLPEMNKNRSGHFMWTCPTGKKVFVAGGVSQHNGAPLDCIEWLDAANPTKWQVLEHKLPMAMQGANTLVHSDGKHILLIGGSTGANPHTTATKEIRQFERSAFDPKKIETVATMEVARYNCFSILGGNDDQIVCIGGTNDKKIDIFEYKTFKKYPSGDLDKINHTVFDSLENYTTDLGLFTCAGC